jgi:hypothetical protein
MDVGDWIITNVRMFETEWEFERKLRWVIEECNFFTFS